MYICTNTRTPEGELPAGMNAGSGKPFATIDFGTVYIAVKTDEDAERIIRAAHRTIAMRRMLGIPHAFVAGGGTDGVGKFDCLHCGMTTDWAGHAEPAPVITDSERTCDQANPASGAWCHRPAPHAEHRDTDGETWTTAGEGGVLFPAGDEPELCDSVMPLTYGGELKCTADAGHYGAHTALGGKHRWLGHGADARTEDGELIAEPAPEPTSYDRAIEQAEFFAQPGNTIDDILAEQRAAS